MRKYIIVRKWAWTSFWDISFGNRIRFWEFAQTINKINNYKYTLLVQSENVDVWGESYFINYPNTIVVRSFPTICNKKVRLIDNAKNYHEGTFVFDDDVIDITPSVDNWNYVRPLWDKDNSKVSTKTDNVVAQEYQKTGHRPIFDIEIYDKKLETIIKEEVKGRVGLHLRGDTPNGQWDIYKKQHPNSRKEYIKQEWGFYGVQGLEADDLVAIHADYQNTVICSPDKDVLKQLEGLHFNYGKMEFVTTSHNDAYKFLCMQILMGDSTDGIPGLPKVGPKTAEKWVNEDSSLTMVLEKYIEKFDIHEGIHKFAETFNLVYLLRSSEEANNIGIEEIPMLEAIDAKDRNTIKEDDSDW